MGRGRGWGKEGNILERKESKREKFKKWNSSSIAI